MSKEDNGGPAFPAEEIIARSKIIDASQGMTLRDWFAGQALFWVINEYNTKRENEAFEFASAIARDCYRLADAMLEARKK